MQLQIEDIYHVIFRNGDQKPIFRDRSDREKFLELLKEALRRHGGRLYVFALMTTHSHKLIGCKDVIAVCNELYCGYSGYFCSKYGESGRIIDWPVDVYKVSGLAKLISDVIYILNNAVKAGLCRNAWNYEFCSFKFYFGKKLPLAKFIDVDVSLVRAAFKKVYYLKKALKKDMEEYWDNWKRGKEFFGRGLADK